MPISRCSANTTAVKYIVDPVGAYPTVLMELDAQTLIPQHWFVHANGQTLAQCDLVPPSSRDRFFLLHDRLGSVRLAVDESAAVKATYTYDPFGNSLENQVAGNFDTPYRFANYWWDEVVGQYYCNARWYDPELARFTGRDPVRGTFEEPLTLHAYLYCLNNPLNRVDPSGEMSYGETIGAAAIMGALAGISSAIFDPDCGVEDIFIRAFIGAALGAGFAAVTPVIFAEVGVPVAAKYAASGIVGWQMGVVAYGMQEALEQLFDEIFDDDED